MLKECKSCKFWNPDGNDSEMFGDCRAIPHDNHTWCYWDERELNNPEAKEFLEQNKAVVVDADDDLAILVTRSDFACCLWEEK